MLSNINFKDYTQSRLDFYSQLSEFQIDYEEMAIPIELDQAFFDILGSNFHYYIEKRLSGPKFSKVENLAYKQLLKELYPQLLSIFQYNGPIVYWFKINYSDGLTNEKILTHYIKTKEKPKNRGWWTKANKICNHTTEILYVGKVERAFENRFIQHIGLGHNYTTALKLQKWIPDLENMSVTLHFLKIPHNMTNHLEDN
ncbi:hypothetical protein AMR72_00025 [Flavobacterium psychrophilum]|nr:hypothetical protein AMR72_00025 [Flavobacterium psychrophilum]AOE51044.1 hypothetical protein ALW18_00025 [Flavobacterium psychrophilum]